MDDVLVSIIIPVYNVKEYINECLDSIINQTYRNIEIILVDDGSTDDSGEICDKYAQKDGRVLVIHKENGGLSDARNVGIISATGKYIMFVDSDDVVDIDIVEYTLSLAEKCSADIANCGYLKINEVGELQEKRKTIDDEIIEGNSECMSSYFMHLTALIACAKLYKKELFDTVKFPVGRWHEDVYTTYLLFAKCNKVVFCGEQKYFYRQRRGSITQRGFNPKHLEAVYAQIECANFIATHYPNLREIACAIVIGVANGCLLRIIRSEGKNKDEIKFLQGVYKEYGGFYNKWKRGGVA